MRERRSRQAPAPLKDISWTKLVPFVIFFIKNGPGGETVTKRFLDCSATDFRAMNKKEILTSIKASEGRMLVSELISPVQPLLYDISNAELAAAFGADILLLNMFDVCNPVFHGLRKPTPNRIIEEIRELTGRIVGVNLEAVDDASDLTPGRRASVATARKAREMGASLIVITGNPGTLVSNINIVRAIDSIKNELGEELIIVAGKMHAAGVLSESGEQIIKEEDAIEFIEAGCDVLLLPAPGTVPGITMDHIRDLVRLAHSKGVLTMTAIGTSQEGADEQTIRNIALMCKMTGTDLHHIGDTGYPGIALPENIMSYSIAIRGRRHTYSRMARSVNR
jgi:hypothetical protein